MLAVLGTGGMAEVYRARDNRLGRDIAIKVISESLAGDPQQVRRFEQEARLAGSLNHPNLVAVYDVGEHEGAPFLVTELLQGESLRRRLARGPLPLKFALDWSAQLAHGLAAAHARGIVHRDVKPDNIFVTSEGQVKLLDFGIAKLAEGSRAAGHHGLMDATETPTGALTGTGAVLGTPGYMSPEQVRGELLDARSDLFSLGAVSYEMLSGQRPFPGAIGDGERLRNPSITSQRLSPSISLPCWSRWSIAVWRRTSPGAFSRQAISPSPSRLWGRRRAALRPGTAGARGGSPPVSAGTSPSAPPCSPSC